MKVVFEILWLTLRDLPAPSTVPHPGLKGMGPAAPPPPLISPTRFIQRRKAENT